MKAPLEARVRIAARRCVPGRIVSGAGALP